MKIHDINHPEDPKANSTLEISVNVQLTRDGTGDHPAVFAILAPTVWDLPANAQLTISSTGYHAGDIEDEVMTLVPADAIEKQKNKPWKEALYEQFGYMDNHADEGELEWTAWVTETVFDIVDGSSNIDGVIKIKFPTNNDNVTIEMGYVFCTWGEGLREGDEWYAEKSKLLKVTGGTGRNLDFTSTPVSVIESITHPYKPVANTQIEIDALLSLNGKAASDSLIVFGMLAPIHWNLGTTGRMSITTSGHAAGDLNEAMVPLTSLSWIEDFTEQFGQADNYGEELEWVLFMTQTALEMSRNNGEDVTAIIKIEFTTGPENIKYRAAYAFCDYYTGFPEGYHSNLVTKSLIIGGGTDPVIDYRKDPDVVYPEPILMSTIPYVFRYDDIFSFRFDAEGEYYEQLVDLPAVYLYGKAVLDDGTVIEIDHTYGTKTLMENIGGEVWQRYIYPPHFFDLPEGKVIREIYFHVQDKDKTVMIDYGGVDFYAEQSAD